MWLIDSTTIRLKFVTGPGSSPYAILSHTWNGNDEVTFQEFTSPDRDIAHPRFQKITETCRLARERGIPYVWVDSCCIDKSSSAELTEAINSMFRWYKESTVCFTYLADLAVDSEIERDLQKCKWFTRGWTMQELVASKNVKFYDAAWNLIGDKISMLKPLTEITRIQEAVLRDSNFLPNYTVARRMSWAANRQTTREEDLAYCLLGIFDVYLPLIYGEGSNAFIRLQEAIAQVTCDLSLFAWTDQDEPERRQRYRGILARSPTEFRNCHHFGRPATWLFPTHEYAITNKGLRFTANLYEGESSNEEEYSLLNLECWGPPSPDSPWELVFIRLVQTPGGYVRQCSDSLNFFSWEEALKLQRGQRREIYISKTMTPTMSDALTTRLLRGYHVPIRNQTRYKCELGRKFPDSFWNMRKGCFMISPIEEFTGLLELSISGDFDVTEEKQPHTELLHWPKVLIVVDTNAWLFGQEDKWPPWAAILPHHEGEDIAEWPLECSYDIISAIQSLYEDNPWSTGGYAKNLLVEPSLPIRKNYAREIEKKYTVRVSVMVTIDADENNTPIACRLAINVEDVKDCES